MDRVVKPSVNCPDGGCVVVVGNVVVGNVVVVVLVEVVLVEVVLVVVLFGTHVKLRSVALTLD